MVKDEKGSVGAQKIASGSQLYTKYMFSLEQIRQAADDTREVFAFGINISMFIVAGTLYDNINEGTIRRYLPEYSLVDGKRRFREAVMLPKAPAQPASLTKPPRKSSAHKSKPPQS